MEFSSAARPALAREVSAPMVTSVPNDAPRDAGSKTSRMAVADLDFYYGKTQALFHVDLEIAANRVTALIGPSGCGKSTLLRTLNRMHETVSHTRLTGKILLDGEDILSQDVTRLRRRVGMVFQRPNPFPKSVYDNVGYGLRINGYKGALDELVEKVCAAPLCGKK